MAVNRQRARCNTNRAIFIYTHSGTYIFPRSQAKTGVYRITAHNNSKTKIDIYDNTTQIHRVQLCAPFLSRDYRTRDEDRHKIYTAITHTHARAHGTNYESPVRWLLIIYVLVAPFRAAVDEYPKKAYPLS